MTMSYFVRILSRQKKRIPMDPSLEVHNMQHHTGYLPNNNDDGKMGHAEQETSFECMIPAHDVSPLGKIVFLSICDRFLQLVATVGDSRLALRTCLHDIRGLDVQKKTAYRNL